MSKKSPKLIVMFDTNVLYTQVASDLVRQDIKRIVIENSNHHDLSIEWYIPDVVIGERKYQMMTKAKELLPSLQKLEKLLGHSFAINEETLELHVNNAIRKSRGECNFKVAQIDTGKIDWNDLISRSVNRIAPFESSEKEKGFRDAVIAQSFIQLQKNLPTTPAICRLALVSQDQRLREYVAELTNESKNVRILSSLGDLESLINTLVSTISEEIATDFAEKANKIFFEKENNKSFYYKENIGEKIREQYSKELSDPILPGHSRSSGTWWIGNPIFIKKDKQRIHWVTIVEPEFEICHYENDQENLNQNSLNKLAELLRDQSTSKILDLSKQHQTDLKPPQLGLGVGLLGQLPSRKKVIDLRGKDKFEIHWSTNLSEAQNLTASKLEKITYLGNNLSENTSIS